MSRSVWPIAVIVLALAPAAQAAEIRVTTPHDLDAGDATTAVAARVCGGEAPATLAAAQNTLNSNEAGQPDVDVTECSFRLALLATRALPASTRVTDPHTIVFELPPGSKTVEVDGSVPLPPVTGSVTIDGCAKVSKPTGPCINLRLPAGTSDPTLGFLGLAPGSALPKETTGLTVLGSAVTITGLAFQNGDPAIWVPPPPGAVKTQAIGGLSVTNSWFGLDIEGKPAAAPVASIVLSGDRATIGGSIFAQGDIGVLIAGGQKNRVQGNWFGLGADGKPLAKLRTGVKIIGLGADGGDDATLTLASGNVIGGSPEGSFATSPACDGPCNLFGGLRDHAIDIGGDPLMGTSATDLPDTGGETVGADGTDVKGNHFGLDGAGAPANGSDAAILVRNGTYDTVIGGEGGGNVLSNTSRGSAVVVEPGAGLGTRFQQNTGRGNRGTMFDLGDDGLGNEADGPSAGVQAPKVDTAEITAISGTAEPGRRVNVYLVPEPENGSHAGDIERWLGSVTAAADGTWKLKGSFPVERRMTAAVEGAGGTSELAKNALVPAPQPVVETPPVELPPVETPPVEVPPPPPPPDTAPPETVKVMGKPPPAEKGPIQVRNSAKFSGSVSDPAGVRSVQIAVALPLVKGKKKLATTRCRFVDLALGKLVKRLCSDRLWFDAKGTTDWRLLMPRVTKRLLNRQKRYILYVRAQDSNFNVAVRRYVIQVKKGRSS